MCQQRLHHGDGLSAILTSPSIKRVFRLTLRAAQGFIDSTGLKVFGEGEWEVKKHGKERRRIWRKLHLLVDAKTHESSVLTCR